MYGAKYVSPWFASGSRDTSKESLVALEYPYHIPSFLLYAPGLGEDTPNSTLRGNVALSSDVMYAEFYKGSFSCTSDVINVIYFFQSFCFILRSEKG